MKRKQQITARAAMTSGLAALILASVPATFTKEIGATVDGIKVDFDGVQPMMVNSHVMVPVRGVFEHMGAEVDWDESTQSVRATRGGDSVRVTVDSSTAMMNGNEVTLEAPAFTRRGRAMVPLRFISEAMRSEVNWKSDKQVVEINTSGYNSEPTNLMGYRMVRIESGTVIPFRLTNSISSRNASVGQSFRGVTENLELPEAERFIGKTTIYGHVESVRSRNSKSPGVIGLDFDKITLADGQSYRLYGTLIGLDSKSITRKDGRLIAKPGSSNDSLKYVGYGAGGAAILATLTKSNMLSSTLLGGALGWLYGQSQPKSSQMNDVMLDSNTKIGIKLERDILFRVKDDTLSQ